MLKTAPRTGTYDGCCHESKDWAMQRRSTEANGLQSVGAELASARPQSMRQCGVRLVHGTSCTCRTRCTGDGHTYDHVSVLRAQLSDTHALVRLKTPSCSLYGIPRIRAPAPAAVPYSPSRQAQYASCNRLSVRHGNLAYTRGCSLFCRYCRAGEGHTPAPSGTAGRRTMCVHEGRGAMCTACAGAACTALGLQLRAPLEASTAQACAARARRKGTDAHQISSTANNGFMSEAADTQKKTEQPAFDIAPVSYRWGMFGTKPSDVATLREIGGVNGLLPGHRTTMAGTLRKHSGHSHSTLTSPWWRVGVGMMPVWIAVRSWRSALTSCPLPLSFPLNPFPP